MFAMINIVFREYDDIVNIRQCISFTSLKYRIDISLERLCCIFQSERHKIVFVEAKRSDNGCFVLVSFVDWDLVICFLYIDSREEIAFGDLIKNIGYSGKRIPTRPGFCI